MRKSNTNKIKKTTDEKKKETSPNRIVPLNVTESTTKPSSPPCYIVLLSFFHFFNSNCVPFLVIWNSAQGLIHNAFVTINIKQDGMFVNKALVDCADQAMFNLRFSDASAATCSDNAMILSAGYDRMPANDHCECSSRTMSNFDPFGYSESFDDLEPDEVAPEFFTTQCPLQNLTVYPETCDYAVAENIYAVKYHQFRLRTPNMIQAFYFTTIINIWFALAIIIRIFEWGSAGPAARDLRKGTFLRLSLELGSSKMFRFLVYGTLFLLIGCIIAGISLAPGTWFRSLLTEGVLMTFAILTLIREPKPLVDTNSPVFLNCEFNWTKLFSGIDKFLKDLGYAIGTDDGATLAKLLSSTYDDNSRPVLTLLSAEKKNET